MQRAKPKQLAHGIKPLTLTPSAKAHRTARWARIMTKWRITRVAKARGWEIVNFTGRRGRESRGIVDLLAIRKDHNAGTFLVATCSR